MWKWCDCSAATKTQSEKFVVRHLDKPAIQNQPFPSWLTDDFVNVARHSGSTQCHHGKSHARRASSPSCSGPTNPFRKLNPSPIFYPRPFPGWLADGIPAPAARQLSRRLHTAVLRSLVQIRQAQPPNFRNTAPSPSPSQWFTTKNLRQLGPTARFPYLVPIKDYTPAERFAFGWAATESPARLLVLAQNDSGANQIRRGAPLDESEFVWPATTSARHQRCRTRLSATLLFARRIRTTS